MKGTEASDSPLLAYKYEAYKMYIETTTSDLLERVSWKQKSWHQNLIVLLHI